MNYNIESINNFYQEKNYEKCILNLHKLINRKDIPIQDELLLMNNYLFCSTQILYSNDANIYKLCENTSTKYLPFLIKVERNHSNLTINSLLNITNNILWWFYIVPFHFHFYEKVFNNLINLIIATLIQGLKNGCDFIHYPSYTSQFSKFIFLVKLFVNNITSFKDYISEFLTLFSLLALHIVNNKMCIKVFQENYLNLISKIEHKKLIKGKLKNKKKDFSKLYYYSYQENVQFENILDNYILILSYSFLKLGFNEKAIHILEKFNEECFYTNLNLIFFQGYFLFLNSKFEECENNFKLIQNQEDEDMKNYYLLVKSYILAKKGKINQAEEMNDKVKKNKKYKLLSLHYKIKIYDLICTEQVNNYEKELISHLEEIITLIQTPEMESIRVEIIKSLDICLLNKLEKEEVNLDNYIIKISNIYLNQENWVQAELKLNQLLKNFNKKPDTFEIYYEKISYIYQCNALAIFKQSRYNEAEEMINKSLTYLMANKSHFNNINLFLENILCSSLILYKILYYQENFENARKALQKALYIYDNTKSSIKSSLIDTLISQIWLQKAKYSIEKNFYSDTNIYFQKALFSNCDNKEILYEYINFKLTKTSSITRFDLTLFEKLIKMDKSSFYNNPIHKFLLNFIICEEDIQKLLILSTCINFQKLI